MAQSSTYVLDASALIAFLTGEEGSNFVVKLIAQAGQGETDLHLAAINLFEVYYDYLKRDVHTAPSPRSRFDGERNSRDEVLPQSRWGS